MLRSESKGEEEVEDLWLCMFFSVFFVYVFFILRSLIAHFLLSPIFLFVFFGGQPVLRHTNVRIWSFCRFGR